jgi:DNA-binding NtrC family response regulator
MGPTAAISSLRLLQCGADVGLQASRKTWALGRAEKGEVMTESIRALFVKRRRDPPDALHLALAARSIGVSTAESCAEAALVLRSEGPPHLVFTETLLADGSWEDVLTLAGNASLPVNVIVVAPVADVGFYLEAIDRGAFDFIVPPLSEPEFQHVVRIAVDNVISRRAKPAAASPLGAPAAQGASEVVGESTALATGRDLSRECVPKYRTNQAASNGFKSLPPR